MKHTIIGLLALLVSYNSYACDVQCPVNEGNVGEYFKQDHFQWTDYDDVTHLLIGFGGAMVIAQALTHYGHMKPWQAALIGAVAMGVIGTTKEVMFDSYTSRTDIRTYWAGGISGGLAFTVLSF